jgi:hypothetical protein
MNINKTSRARASFAESSIERDAQYNRINIDKIRFGSNFDAIEWKSREENRVEAQSESRKNIQKLIKNFSSLISVLGPPAGRNLSSSTGVYKQTNCD